VLDQVRSIGCGKFELAGGDDRLGSHFLAAAAGSARAHVEDQRVVLPPQRPAGAHLAQPVGEFDANKLRAERAASPG
jgi:hypothetical protein